jgi:hypothetical protein
MFMADALARAARTADDGRALAVQPTVNDDDLQASERLPDANGLDGHWNTVWLPSGCRLVGVWSVSGHGPSVPYSPNGPVSWHLMASRNLM